MAQNKISISSTSYLIPNHYAWNEKFSFTNKLDFKFVNNFTQGFYNSPKENTLFTAIFINDLIDENKNYKNKDLKKINDSLINLVKFRLRNSSSPLILFLINQRGENIFDYLSTKNMIDENFENLYDKLLFLSKKHSNFILLNFNSIFENSNKNIFDKRNWYLANCRLSSYGHELIATSLKKILTKFVTTPKKVLVLDCDNTLWGGIVGEDGIDNILLGQDGIGKAYVDFQRKIKKLSQQGVLLCISSKNNTKDVMEVFNNHKQMQISKNDLVSIKVNWKEKYLNIKEIAKDLNLSLDSIVFWDDNPLERNKVKKFLPEVYVVEPDQNIINWPTQIENFELFSKIKITKEDKNKIKQYKIRSKFIDEKKIATDEIKYLKSIKLEPKVINLNKDNIARASQMTQKTNQFNLRTKRYSMNDILQLNKKEYTEIKLISLKDLYGDHGIIGLMILKKIDKYSVFIDTFLISCRVFGRYLETWMLYEIKKICKKKGINKIYGEHIVTDKNKIICKDFFKKHSFKIDNGKFSWKSPGSSVYSLRQEELNNKMIKIYD